MTIPILEENSLHWLLEALVDAVLIADSDGSIVFANASAERLFGYGRDELGSLQVENLIPERFRQLHRSQRAEYANTPHSRPMGSSPDLKGQRKDGTEFPVEVSLSPLQTAQGVFVMAVIHDITKRKAAEEALARQAAELQESEARMRAVVDTAVDGVIVIDERGLIDRFNRSAERMFGYSAEQAVGKNVSMLMPSPDREQHDAYLHRYVQTGEKKIIGIGREVVGRRRDGSTFPLDLAVSEMDLGGRRMFTGIVRDITERRQADERQAHLIHELEAANEELKNFAYVVSHDLKAPLRAIGSLADWLSTDYADKFDEEGKEHMRLLISRVHRMDGLIDGILQYSRVGRVREAVVPVNLNVLVKDVIDLLAPPASVSIAVPGNLPTVAAEPTRLQQLFQNLLSNAVKYMDKPEGKIEVACVERPGVWEFSVSDNGPGIEERHFEKIFQLFQTLAPRDRVESTGVGLALVKKIVEMYGGRIWVQSKPGQGSTFFFTFPKDDSITRAGAE
jgi:two-component system sensor kinase FixL